jgi:hypothetical protein
MLDDKIEHKAQLKKILKPEQFQKWEQKLNYRKEIIAKSKRMVNENKE